MFSRAALASVVLAACGPGPSSSPPDARRPDAPDVDAPIDAPPSDCDYTEQSDATNDDTTDPPGSPEQTGITIGARTVVCGKFEHTHFDGDITADVDSYVFTVPSETDVLVRVHGAGAEVIEYAGVDVYGGPSFSTTIGSATFYGDHGVVAVHLPAGTYELAAFALSSAPLTSTVAYKLEITTDTPATRCPEIMTGGFAEANDGANNNGNDVVTIPSGAPPALTASTADMPEPTGITLDVGNTRVTGSVADVATTDHYEDKDTFAFSTGASTNELAVRLTWPGSGANLDFLLFEANDPSPVFRAIAMSTTGPELRTHAVKPNTNYWLLVGAKTGSTGLPVDYTASLCGATFTP
jgi:hypothetical protein